jgi:hypothetical protein
LSVPVNTEKPEGLACGEASIVNDTPIVNSVKYKQVESTEILVTAIGELDILQEQKEQLEKDIVNKEDDK